MAEEKCLQCGQITNETFNRIIRDSCGHYKCRSCLLKEDTQCFACDENARDFATNVEKSVIISTMENKRSGVVGLINISESGRVIDGSKEDQNCSVIVNHSIPSTKVNVVKKTSRRKKALPLHILLESAEEEAKSYLCTVCKKRFHARSQVKYHSFCNATKPFACTLCEKKFVKKSQLKYHLDVHSGNKTFSCDNCDATFYNRSKLKTHMKTHTGLKTFQCTECESTFSSGYLLKKHSLRHSNLKPFVCKTCGTAFRDSSNLKKHEIHIHRVVPAEKHPCQECGKIFKRKVFLTKHMKTHTKIRPFGCSICSRAFRSKKDRNRHEIIHTDTRQFQCQVCDNTFFKRKDNLERHFRNTHSDVDPLELQNSVIKRVSAIDLSTEKTEIENSRINPKTNCTQINNTAAIASTAGFLESETFDDQPLADDYYQNKSEFRNYKNYIPKEFNSFSTNDEESVETIANNIDSDLISLPCVDSGADANKLINYPSRSEIIEANNKRQSVIFNPPAYEESCLQSSISNITYPENNLIINEYSEPTPFNLTIATNNETTDSIPQDMSNNVIFKEGASEENENAESSAGDKTATTQSSSKTQKRTINVSEVYKQMFPNGSQVNFTNRRMSNPTKKVEPATKVSPYKYFDKMADTQSDGNPRKLTYIHKKVHYDLNNFLNKKTTSSLAFEDRYGKIVKEHNEQRNLNQNSQGTYFSPESLELYKKILIPSYKGSSETTASTNNETKTDHSVDVQKESLKNVSGSNVPPLAPISDHFPPTKTSFNDNSSGELPLPLLVPLGKKNNASVPGKTIPEAQTPSHSNDIHWRRRLAHSSNNV